MAPLTDFLRRLFEPAPGPPSAVYLVLVALFLLLFVGGAGAFFLRRSLFPGHSLHIRLARRFGAAAMAVAVVGLILLGARYLGIYLLQMRFFLVLATLGVVALAAYLAWYLRESYPVDLAAHQVAKARDRFVRPSAHSPRRRSRKARR